MDRIIGIDVSKERLDVAVWPQGEAFAVGNDDDGIRELTSRLKAIGAPMQSRSKRLAVSRPWQQQACLRRD